MQVSNLSSNVSFGRVYAVAGSKAGIDELSQRLAKAKGKLVTYDATSLYKNTYSNSKTACAKAASMGDSIMFFITGKKDTKDAQFMKKTWSSLIGISQNITDFIKLTDIDEAEKILKKEMKR